MDHAPIKRRRIHEDFLRIVDEYVRRCAFAQSLSSQIRDRGFVLTPSLSSQSLDRGLATFQKVQEAVETATMTELDLALRKAVLADDLELVNLLLENGADPDIGLTEPCVEAGGKCLTNCLHQAIISDKPEIYKALIEAGATQKDHQSHETSNDLQSREKSFSIHDMIMRSHRIGKKEMAYYAMQYFSVEDALKIAKRIFSGEQQNIRYDEQLVLLLDRCDMAIRCALVNDLIQCDRVQYPRKLGAKVVEYVLSHVPKEDLKKRVPFQNNPLLHQKAHSFYCDAFHTAHGMTEELSCRLVKNGFYPNIYGLYSKIETLKVILEDRGETFDTSTVYLPDELRFRVGNLLSAPITPFKLEFFDWVVTTSDHLIHKGISNVSECIIVMEKMLASVRQAGSEYLNQFWRVQMSLSKLVGLCMTNQSFLPDLLNLGRACGFYKTGAYPFYKWCLFYPAFLSSWTAFQRILPVETILDAYRSSDRSSSGKDISFFRQISLIADKASFHPDNSSSTEMTLIREGKYRRNLPRNTGSFIPSLFSLVPFDRALEIWTLTSLHVLETSNEGNLIGRIPKEILFHIFWFMVPKIPLIFYQNPDGTIPFYDLEYPF